MQRFDPIDPGFESRVRHGFSLQRLMATIGAQMTVVAPGEVRIELPFNPAWTQQHSYMHAGVITSIVDSACGFAAYTLMPATSGVLTAEYKVNFLSPAKGEIFIAVGKVVKPGRTLTVCNGEVMAVEGGEQKIVAVMQATMMAVPL
ncbi:MAG TPA: PaaI family thioesterase [Blastocatellia bacterium]|nr:PaaI family thioesterase [Blastocatellia bacterium]